MTAPAQYFATALDDIKEDLTRRGIEIYDFGVGDPVEPTPEFIRQALIDALDPVSQYPTVFGQRRLREAIAGYHQRRLNVTLDADTQVLPAGGSKEAIFHLPLALLRPDEKRRRIVYPSPSYPVYDGSARFSNAIAHPVVLREDNAFRLDLRELGPKVLEETRIAWLNYPHNPTGASVDIAYLREQVAIAREYDILLCGDDCYLDLYFPNVPPPPGLLQVSVEGVLSVGSLSKRSGMTGYRSGYIAGDASVIGLLKRARPNFGVASQNFVQAAATAAWSDDAHVAERRATFGAKRERLVSFLESHGYTVTGSQGAIYVWARVPDNLGAAFFDRLLEHGIVVSPGESFGPGGEGYFRLALVPMLDQIDRALAVWETISL
jgi:succinyldiaminopimelate transaminase